MEASAEDKATSLELFFRGENATLQSLARDLHIIQAVSALLGERTPAAQAVLITELTSHMASSGASGSLYILDAQQGVVVADVGQREVVRDQASRRFENQRGRFRHGGVVYAHDGGSEVACASHRDRAK